MAMTARTQQSIFILKVKYYDTFKQTMAQNYVLKSKVKRIILFNNAVRKCSSFIYLIMQDPIQKWILVSVLPNSKSCTKSGQFS